MADKKQIFWRWCEPFRFFTFSLPSIRDYPRRWALFQVILSLAFFFAAIAVGLLAVDMSQVESAIMAIAIALFGLAVLCLLYAIAVGLHWYSEKNTVTDNTEAERIKRDDKLHEDIQALIQEIRQERDERKRS